MLSSYVWTGNNTTIYITSDGATVAQNAYHTWDASFDRPCSRGYGMRGVIVCATTINQALVVGPPNGCPLLWIKYNGVLGNSVSIQFQTNLECIDFGEVTNSPGIYIRNSNVSIQKIVPPPNQTGTDSTGFLGAANMYDFTWPKLLTYATGGYTSVFDGDMKLPFDKANIVFTSGEIGNRFFYQCRLFDRQDIMDTATEIRSQTLQDTGFAKLSLPNVRVVYNQSISGLKLNWLSFGPNYEIYSASGPAVLFDIPTLTCFEIAQGWIPNANMPMQRFLGWTPDNFMTYFANRLGKNTTGVEIIITIPTVLYNQLTSDERQIIIDKGYTLASA